VVPVPRAGWYEDPGGDGYRWWDGSTWTARVATAGDDLNAPRPPPRRAAPRAAPRAARAEPAGNQAWVAGAIALLVAGGAVLLVVGAVQPWVKATAPGTASVTRMGTDARAGWLIMLAGVIVALEAGRWLQQHKPSRAGAVVALAMALGTAAVAVLTFTHLAAGVATLPGATGTVTRTAGMGVPLIAAGCVAVFSGAVAAALHPVG
jgi:hypothetical protein